MHSLALVISPRVTKEMKMATRACFILVVSLSSVNFALAARIAGFSGAPSGSHYFSIRTVMEELSSRGHEVVLVRPATHNEPSSTDQKVPHKTFQIPYDDTDSFDAYLAKTAIEGGPFKTIITVFELQIVTCELLLNNTQLLQELRNFDLIVYESFAACSVLVADLLGIPRVILIPSGPNTPASFFFQVPFPLSYVPSRFTPFTSEMSFTQRLVNFGVHIFCQFVADIMFARYMDPLKEKYNITPEMSYGEAVGKAELVFFIGDFTLEYPQPLLPGHIMVGAITAKPKPNPLPPDLEDFINSAGGHGFIIASFGSYAQKVIPKEKIDVLAAAFGKLKQNVIWKLKGYIPSSLGSNIKVVEWLPQNDLLAHKDLKVFVSHVGLFSLYESAYHGVPVVAVPLFADQFTNARRAEHFGIAKVVDHQTLNSQVLFEAIQQVVKEPRFKNAAMRISRIMKDSPRTPLEKTVDWIEYVVRHGGARHLRAQVFNIPWYQYYLLDIMAFLVAIVTLVVMVIRLTCRCMCHVCCKKGVSKTKED